MNEQRGSAGSSEEGASRRYCSVCGEIFSATHRDCPNCGTVWTPPTGLSVAALATLLTDLPRLRSLDVIDEQSCANLRLTYEHWLTLLRPARTERGSHPSTSGAPALIADTPPSHGAEPRRATFAGGPRNDASLGRALSGQRSSDRPSLSGWTAARQADLTLYLGAFLLSIAAVIFVGYQGQALSGAGRFAVLAAYTLAFLALGVALPRWERVREAGAVFLALGAVLVPATFIALRVQVLGGSVAASAIWLSGALVTAVLYASLAWRGHGRAYLVGAAIAAVVAWGALGAVAALPVVWFGAWYAGAAALLSCCSLLLAGGPPRERRGWQRWRSVYAGDRAPAGPVASAPRIDRVWIEGGVALIGGCALLYAHAAALLEPNRTAQLPVAYAFVVAAGAVNALGRPSDRLAPLPILLALTALSTSWSAFGLTAEWFGCLLVGGALGFLVLAELDPRLRTLWRLCALAVALFALLWSHGAALAPGATRIELPVTYAIVLAGAAWDAARRRAESLLLLPLLAAIGGSSLLWAIGVPPAWWGIPWFASALAVLVTMEVGGDEHSLEALSQALLVLLSALPPLALWLSGAFLRHPAQGFVDYLVAAPILFAAGLRARGTLTAALAELPVARARTLEQWLLTRLAGSFIFGAAGYFNAWARFDGGDRAWAYAALAMAAWLGLGVSAARRPSLLTSLAPAGLLASLVAAVLARENAGEAAFVLALAAVGPGIAFVSVRRWLLWAIAAAFAAAALAFAWRWLGVASAALPLAYLAVAALLSLALTSLRHYTSDERGIVVVALSWAPWLLAFAVAYLLLERRAGLIGAGVALVRTREWAVLTLTVAAGGSALGAEALRLPQRWLAVAGSAGLLVALLLAIAIVQPSNPQAYTAPIGFYLVALGLLFRRSTAVFHEHLEAHESLIVAGLLFFPLPPAVQSFAGAANLYLLELVVEGLIILTLGLMLAERWLTVGAVLTFTGIAVRALSDLGRHAPFWLTLGTTGLVLLGIGILLLLQRERWDRTRDRIVAWWRTPPAAPRVSERR